MKNLNLIYDKAFFKEWGCEHEKYIRSAEIITDILFDLFGPKKIADLGCGCGIYSHLFEKKDAEVLALDGVMPPKEYSFPINIHEQDLTVPFENTWGRFDLTLCLEVAEHIPENLTDIFLDNILKFSDTLVLSAAPKGQEGHHHVNEQPKRYWVKKLAEKGFAYNRIKTGTMLEKLKKDKLPYMWMCEQISFYEKADKEKLNHGLPLISRS
ncbi:MAG: hypothetical protein KAR84_07920 [Elusimicrobiales bacterium]|nr:hypothetical protein [Elusimicrobiales bacterium]MCK5358229.1 hypothetical protein [Elusimicrobiales bacterium]